MTRDILPVVKLTDFGLSRTISNLKNNLNFRGVRTYAAPEMLEIELNPKDEKRPLNEKSDIYALGITLLYVSLYVKFLVDGVKNYKSFLMDIK